jgi:hypothetical protein
MSNMKRIRILLRDAKRIAAAYADSDIIELCAEQDLPLQMARNSFIAHSIFAGHERRMVERVAKHVFNYSIHQN